MNLFLVGTVIFVIIYLFLNWFAKTSSKKIAQFLKRLAVLLSVALATIFAVGGKFLFSKIEGDEDSIMGLPVKKIKEYLKKYE